jgi:hypothetical protein
MEIKYVTQNSVRKITLSVLCLMLVGSIQLSYCQNVGITNAGSIIPQNLLHVHNSQTGGSMFQLTNATTTSGSGRGFVVDIDNALKVMFKNMEAGTMAFFTSNTERVTILSGGNVGIGLTTPASKLHVAGELRLGIPLGGLGGAAATLGSMTLYNASNANTVNIKSGITSASYALTLPIAQGANGTFLRNDGAGNLSWAAGSGTKILDIVLTNATTYTLSGLDGNNDIGYRIVLMGNHPNTNTGQKFGWISINGDVTATNYSYGVDAYWNYDGLYGWSYDAYSIGGILLYATYAIDNPSYICVEAVLSAFNGTRRHAIVQYSLGRGNTRSITDNLLAGVWTNSTTNITSLVFNWTANSGFTGRLIVYKFQN